MSDGRAFYGDETTTGRQSPSFRYLGRATIAARTSESAGFEWLLRIRREFLPGVAEPKSDLVLELIEHDRGARDLVLGNVGSASILVIDLAEHYRQIFGEMCRVLGLPEPIAPESINLLLRGQHKELATSILRLARQSALYSTAIPTVEALFRDSLKACDIPIGEGNELVNRAALQEMGAQEFREMLARFSLAFADALDPVRQASRFMEVAEQRYLPPGYFSVLVLGDTLNVDVTLDVGSVEAFNQVRTAHELVADRLAAAQRARLGRPPPHGRLLQDDSREVLGIQAADIAAGIAAREYERYPENRRGGAEALKQMFDRVFFNDDWV
ncbi:MAG: hypothetical protein ACE5MG_08700 [Candidatus Methylomirabilales bacterium]